MPRGTGWKGEYILSLRGTRLSQPRFRWTGRTPIGTISVTVTAAGSIRRGQPSRRTYRIEGADGCSRPSFYSSNKETQNESQKISTVDVDFDMQDPSRHDHSHGCFATGRSIAGADYELFVVVEPVGWVWQMKRNVSEVTLLLIAQLERQRKSPRCFNC